MATTISAKDVMALRAKTGLGMMECKEALAETGGDVQAAVDLLRKKGLAKMDSRSDREAKEGKIAVAVQDNPPKGAIVELTSETDFVAGNEMFIRVVQELADKALRSSDAGDVQKSDEMQKLIDELRLTTKENVQFGRGAVLGGTGDTKIGSYLHFTGKIGVLVEVQSSGGGDADEQLLRDLCMHISAARPLAVTEQEVPAELVAKEREIAKAQALESGKPENIAEKMVEGRVRKYFEEVVLLRQPFVKDDKKQIKDILPKGTTIKSFVRYQIGG
jgi:elongation factor Ts